MLPLALLRATRSARRFSSCYRQRPPARSIISPAAASTGAHRNSTDRVPACHTRPRRSSKLPSLRKNPDDLGRKTAKSGMQLPILVTKLFTPPRAVESISRPRLVEKKNSGLARKLTLVARRRALANRSRWADGRPTAIGPAYGSIWNKGRGTFSSFWLFWWLRCKPSVPASVPAPGRCCRPRRLHRPSPR